MTKFDQISRVLATPMPRRRALAVIGGVLASGVAAGFRPGSAHAEATCVPGHGPCNPGDNCCGPTDTCVGVSGVNATCCTSPTATSVSCGIGTFTCCDSMQGQFCATGVDGEGNPAAVCCPSSTDTYCGGDCCAAGMVCDPDLGCTAPTSTTCPPHHHPCPGSDKCCPDNKVCATSEDGTKTKCCRPDDTVATAGNKVKCCGHDKTPCGFVDGHGHPKAKCCARNHVCVPGRGCMKAGPHGSLVDANDDDADDGD